MIKIKISARGAPLNAQLSQFLGNDENQWGNCKFYVNSDIAEPDFWFILEEPDDGDRAGWISPDRIFFLTAETSWPSGHYAESPGALSYLNQFARVFTCHDVYLPNVTYTAPFLPWMINANHGPSIFAPHQRDFNFFNELKGTKKDKTLSVFCSAQALTAPHRMRLRFVEKLKEHFGDQLDWYGNGVQPLDEKWEGIAPYKYTIALENHSSNNVITEKLQDAFLGLSYPIYWGAPNVHQYFDQESFSQIDIKDLSGSIESIERIVSTNTYENRIDSLLESKNRVISEVNFLNRIAKIAEGIWDREGIAPKKHVEIQLPGSFAPPLNRPVSTFVQRAGNFIQRKGSSIRM